MFLFRLLLHAASLFLLSDHVTAVTEKDVPSSPASSSSPSSSSSLVFGVRKEGQQHHILPAAGVEKDEDDDDEKMVKEGEEKNEKSEEEDMWASAMTDNTPETQNNTEILAQVGGEATFTCFTHHLSDELVTWLKRDDDQLLTVGQQVYAAENRFSATHSHQNKAWELWVKDVQLSDAGHYECQLTTHPPVTFFFTLKVTQAEAVVSGGSEVHIEEGSQLALECHILHAASPPVYIFWYHNDTMVNYGRHKSLEIKHRNYTSSLVVTKVMSSDAGTYTCDPHLATPANVTVHVVTGKTPAAMQVEGGGVSCRPPSFSTVAAAFLLTLLLQSITDIRCKPT